MKTFVNDWSVGTELYVLENEEKQEFVVNSWVTIMERRCFFVSAYVYEDFVMLLLIEDFEPHKKSLHTPMPFRDYKNATQYEQLLFTKNNNYKWFGGFETEINGLKMTRGSSGSIYPIADLAANDQYDYLTDYVTKENKIPPELAGKELMFYKNCVSFTEKIDKIDHIALYPYKFAAETHWVEKTFRVPFGECDIKVPYTLEDTGEESFIIAKGIYKYNHIKSMKESGAFDNLPEALKSLEEDENELLVLRFAKPEQRRNFQIYTNDYLNSKIVPSNSSRAIGFIYSDELVDGLHEAQVSLGELQEGETKDYYDLTLMSVTNTYDVEHKPYFEISFDEATK